MKKFKFNKKLTIFLLVIIMGLTTVVSFVFWSAGITGPENEDETLFVAIGEGEVTLTEITLEASDSSNANDALIPRDLEPRTGETIAHVFTIEVEWIDADGLATGLEGTLNAEMAELRINDSVFTGNGLNGETLFDVDIEIPNGADIVANDESPVTVTVTLSMGQPLNPAQYEIVAGGNLAVDIVFSVEHEG